MNEKELEKLPRADKIFASQVFHREERKKRLSRKVFSQLEETISNRKKLDTSIAEPVAKAIKEWALEKGATHYTHWFQPLTGSTAEKHDSFIDLKSSGKLDMKFSGKMLTQGEPDASSFPSGGLRATFEARGYTIWDPISPVFIRKTDYGATLCIPSVFCSYTGEALDLKTPLLRSHSALVKSTKRLLKVLGENYKNVHTTIGIEQEYFLVDRSLYFARPDLVACGRTVMGNPPYRGQELDDHYFGSIKNKVLLFMQDAEHELYQLGVPVKTRHNEVAPSQFEVAPIFQDAILSVDQNLLVMEVLDEVAERHDLKLLIHEKPFAGINGSGKHCNWSVSADGENLLDPTKNPQENLRFLLMIAAIVRAVDKNAEVLRISIASAGNDHRLGANEAPPAIMSIFLGDALGEFVEQIAKGKKSIFKKSKDIDLSIATLPEIPKQDTDRNRTSPFAFTGNKFEFRALGSSQNAATPNFTLNTIVADSMDYISEQLEKKIAQGEKLKPAVEQTIKAILQKHLRVIFNGDNYSDAWLKEAKKRGLPNLQNSADAFAIYNKKEIVDMFEKQQVLSKKEIVSRQNVRSERYSNLTEIEARALLDIVNSMVLPSSYAQQEQLSNSIVASKQAGLTANHTKKQKEELLGLTKNINLLIEEKEKLVKLMQKRKTLSGEVKVAKHYQSVIIPSMNKVREYADNLEGMVDDSLWQLPKYREMLFS